MHITEKTLKVPNKTLKTATVKHQVIYKGRFGGPTIDFSAETLHNRRKWGSTFKIIKEKYHQQKYFNQQNYPQNKIEIKFNFLKSRNCKE